jgi:hypothetical protein
MFIFFGFCYCPESGTAALFEKSGVAGFQNSAKRQHYLVQQKGPETR